MVFHYNVHVHGKVQGVGFRPTVYRYAIENELTGFILNTGEGVTLEVQGKPGYIDSFINVLKKNPPRASRMLSFVSEEIQQLIEEDQ